MASKTATIGTGAALAGLGGLAAAAVTVHKPDAAPAARPAPQVETRTVVVRTVEHRVKRVRSTHHTATGAATAAAAAAAQPAPVVQAPPVPVTSAPAPVSAPAPIRTRTSGAGGRSGDEHESGHGGAEDAAEHADD